jgi:ribosomal protein S12 methylthiotransferase
LTRIKAWRLICPDLTIRSTFIVGFPGETDEDFEHLLDFLHEAQLDRVGCFAYSPVDGAKANELGEHVAEQVKEERRARFMQAQEQISRGKLNTKVGRQMRVLVDDIDGETAIARSAADAPEIDGLVYIQDGARLRRGEFAEVTIRRSDTHDLWAVPVAA